MPWVKPIRVEVELAGVAPNVVGVKGNANVALCKHVPIGTSKQPPVRRMPFANVEVALPRTSMLPVTLRPSAKVEVAEPERESTAGVEVE